MTDPTDRNGPAMQDGKKPFEFRFLRDPTNAYLAFPEPESGISGLLVLESNSVAALSTAIERWNSHAALLAENAELRAALTRIVEATWSDEDGCECGVSDGSCKPESCFFAAARDALAKAN